MGFGFWVDAWERSAPVAGPEEGCTDVTRTSRTYSSGTGASEKPAASDPSAMVATPMLPGGARHVASASLTARASRAAVPTRQSRSPAARKLVPERVRRTPPDAGDEDGVTSVTTGVASGRYWKGASRHASVSALSANTHTVASPAALRLGFRV